MTISLNELDNSDNLEDGKPSNTLFTYYVTGHEYSTCFEPCTPQYKKLKSGMINSLSMKITDQNNNRNNCSSSYPIIYSRNFKWNTEND